MVTAGKRGPLRFEDGWSEDGWSRERAHRVSERIGACLNNYWLAINTEQASPSGAACL